jgi:hypothetical protein
MLAGNAFAVYPASPLKSAAIVTMVVDQLTAYGLFVHPLCILWEKLLRVHYKPNWIKLPARIPVGELQQRRCESVSQHCQKPVVLWLMLPTVTHCGCNGLLKAER